MKIFIPGQTDTINGVSTYINSLVTVLKDRGHLICENNFDVAFVKSPYNFSPAIIHEHAAVIPSLRYDMYKGWTQTKGHLITVNSEFQKEQLVTAGVSAPRIYWLPNCVDENVFYPRDVLKTKKILYLGRAGQNNQNTFFTLLKFMEGSSYQLDVIGSVDQYIGKEIEKYNIYNVNFLGEISDRNVLAETISTYSFGIGVGRAAMEMSLCGLPVMIFGQGWEGFITERNVEMLHYEANMTTRMSKELSFEEKVDKIHSVICDVVPLRRERAVEIFGLRRNIHIYEKLFEDLINENL
jgi:glycosyltransferase involved in cell wall biosynthesis